MFTTLDVTMDSSGDWISAQDCGLRFRVRRNEEYVDVAVQIRNELHVLAPRAHHYTLLTLARQRLADQANPKLAPQDHGWVTTDDLCRKLATDENKINVEIFRIRQEFLQLPLQNGAAIIERKKGSKTHIAVDTLGHLLALYVTPANEQDRAQVAELARRVQEVTEQSVEVAFVDQGYTGDQPAQAAQGQGMHLEVIKLPEAKKGFVLLPRRWVVERSFGWAARFRRLARDYERLPETLVGLHYLAFAILMLKNFVSLMAHVL